MIDGEIIKLSVTQSLKSWVKLPFPHSLRVLFTVRRDDGFNMQTRPNLKGKVNLTDDLNLLSEVYFFTFHLGIFPSSISALNSELLKLKQVHDAYQSNFSTTDGNEQALMDVLYLYPIKKCMDAYSTRFVSMCKLLSYLEASDISLVLL